MLRELVCLRDTILAVARNELGSERAVASAAIRCHVYGLLKGPLLLLLDLTSMCTFLL